MWLGTVRMKAAMYNSVRNVSSSPCLVLLSLLLLLLLQQTLVSLLPLLLLLRLKQMIIRFTTATTAVAACVIGLKWEGGGREGELWIVGK